VVDLIIGQGSFGNWEWRYWGSGSRSVAIRVLRRLSGCEHSGGAGFGAAEERYRNGEVAVRYTEVSGAVVNIRTAAPAQADLTTSVIARSASALQTN